jgi:hypothetical protein
MTWKDVISQAGQVAAIAGVIAAGLYFTWKVLTGWLIINLHLELEVVRVSRGDEKDLLAATIILDKGAIDTLRLTGVMARAIPVASGPTNAEIVQFMWAGLDPHLYYRTRGGTEWRIPEKKDIRKLTLSPGDRTQFATAHEVLAGQTYVVEAIVLGHRWFLYKRGLQWRASSISPPVATTAKEHARSVMVAPPTNTD